MAEFLSWQECFPPLLRSVLARRWVCPRWPSAAEAEVTEPSHAHNAHHCLNITAIFGKEAKWKKSFQRYKWLRFCMYVFVWFCLFFLFFISVHWFLPMCELLVDVPPPPLCFNPATVFFFFLATAGRRAAKEGRDFFGGKKASLWLRFFFFFSARRLKIFEKGRSCA